MPFTLPFFSPWRILKIDTDWFRRSGSVTILCCVQKNTLLYARRSPFFFWPRRVIFFTRENAVTKGAERVVSRAPSTRFRERGTVRRRRPRNRTGRAYYSRRSRQIKAFNFAGSPRGDGRALHRTGRGRAGGSGRTAAMAPCLAGRRAGERARAPRRRAGRAKRAFWGKLSLSPRVQ